MTVIPNDQYNVAPAGSLPVRIAETARRRMFDVFLRESGLSPSDGVLEVGVTSDTTYASSNYLIEWYPFDRSNITAVGLQDCAFLEPRFPGLRVMNADGKALPFPDNSFDVVHSSAVLEHVGSREEQRKFIVELHRVARRCAFLTTPDRRFPIEFHTLLPLLHWLPDGPFRSLLRRLGFGFFADENNLNLLYKSDVRRLCCGLGNFTVTSLYTFGLPSNILVCLWK